MYLLEVLHDGANVITVVNAHFDGSLENTLLAGDEYLVDVDIHL